MATINGTFASNNNNLNLYIVWSSTQDVSNNKSTVTAKLYLKKVTSYAQTYKTSTSCSITINGNTSNYTKSIDTRSWEVGSTHLIETKTLDVSHNADGTKSIKIGGVIDFSGLNPGKGTVPSTSVTLPTIPRASTFSVSGTKNVGSTITINITRASSSFTHTVQVAFNGGSYSNIATGVGTSTTYTLPTSWASSMTSSTAPFNIKVITYNGSTKIGEKTGSYTVSLSNSYAPTISSVSISEGNSSVTTGSFVQNLSKLKISVSATAKNGATIKTYKYEVNGSTVASGTSSSITTGTITDVGTVTVKVTVTDSKGLSTSSSKNITVIGQGDINISNFQAVRTNSSGTADDNGGYFTIYCSLSATFSMTATLQYKLSSSSSWSSKSLGSIGTSYTYNWYNPSINIGTLYSYDIRLKITTSYATKYSKTVTIMPSYVIMDFKSDGKGVCFGSTCTQNGVEVKNQNLIVTNGDIKLSSGKWMYMAGRLNLQEGSDISLSRVSSGGETNLYFESCGNGNLRMKIYGGASTSSTQFGVWDLTNSRYVWKYHSSKKLYIGSSIIMEPQEGETTQTITMQTSDGTDGHAIHNNTTDKIMYFGMPNLDGKAHQTTLRGLNVRIYTHSGGGVYLGSSGSTAITSDRNLKKDIEELDDRYIKFFSMLTPVTYIYKDGGHRKHVGFIAQDVEDALKECDLTTEDFAGLVKETDVKVGTDDDNLTHYDELYSLRYEEFIALNTKVIQNLLSRIKDLEAKVFKNK